MAGGVLSSARSHHDPDSQMLAGSQFSAYTKNVQPCSRAEMMNDRLEGMRGIASLVRGIYAA